MWKVVLVGALALTLSGCITKDKCLWLELDSGVRDGDYGSIETLGPSTTWFDISTGKVEGKGPLKYKSCPKGEDPAWMREPAVEPPPNTP